MPTFTTVLFIGLLIVLIWFIFKRKSLVSTPTEQLTDLDHRLFQVQSIQQLGDYLQTNATHNAKQHTSNIRETTLVDPRNNTMRITINQPSINSQSMGYSRDLASRDLASRDLASLNPERTQLRCVRSLNPARPQLPKQLREFKNKVASFVIGKYKLEDQSQISYTHTSLERILDYLLNSHDAKSIISHYDPSQSDVLLLETCRDLFEFAPISPVTKMLIGQFIANKTPDGEEIDMVYNYISAIALSPTTDNTTRMNAADILNLSNNRKYMIAANKSLEILRNAEDSPLTRLRHASPKRTSRQLQPTSGQIINIPPLRRAMPLVVNRLGHDIRHEDLHLQTALFEQIGTRMLPKTDRTLYKDGQNVHNSELNNSVLNAANNLVKAYQNSSNLLSFDYTLIKDLPESQKNKIETSLHRIMTDSTVFKHNHTLHIVFQALLSYINTNPNKSDLNIRLLQELEEMSSLCATGHLSRLINVVQGYSNTSDADKNLQIKINPGEEIYAKLSHIIQKQLESHPDSDNIMDSMISNDQQVFLEFVADISNNLMIDLRAEYTNILTHREINSYMLSSLRKYTKTPKFAIVNDKILP